MNRSGNMLLRVALAIPPTYVAVRLFINLSWVRHVAVSGWLLVYLVGVTVLAIGLLVGSAALIAKWNKRWVWVLVAGCALCLAVIDASLASAFGRLWDVSSTVAMEVYVLVLAIALALAANDPRRRGVSTSDF